MTSADHHVLDIFYSHPGVFVSPSQRAITIAHAEGFQTKVLRVMTAEDYLFADLGFNPAYHGCNT